MARLIDDSFNPHLIMDPYNKELLTLQQVYFWTVVTRSFKTPLGITALHKHLPSSHHATPNAISCYLKHQDLQNHSLARPVHIAAQCSEFAKLHLITHLGRRASFLTQWFSKLQLLDQARGTPMDISDVFLLLLDATSSDVEV